MFDIFIFFSAIHVTSYYETLPQFSHLQFFLLVNVIAHRTKIMMMVFSPSGIQYIYINIRCMSKWYTFINCALFMHIFCMSLKNVYILLVIY